MKAEETYQHLADKAKEYTGLNIAWTRTRKFEIIMIKGCVINIMYRYFGYNTVQIGKAIGMHHSSIIYHQNNHPHRYRNEPEYGNLYDYLAKHCTLDESSAINVDEMIQIMKRTMSF